MDSAHVRVTLLLIAPAVLTVFGVAFLCIWWTLGRRTYLLQLAAACGLFAAGVSSQVLALPADLGANALVSGFLYTAAVCLTVQGVLERVGRSLPWAAYAAYAAAILGALWYFFYVDRNLLLRVYVLNAGFGLLFCFGALRMRSRAARRADTALFVVLFLFGLHFLPRTLLTLGTHAPQNQLAFANSTFWQVMQLSLAVFSVALAITMLVAIAADAMDEIRQERDHDWLTGVYNRRGFHERVRPYRHRTGLGATLIVGDVDHFKRINDAYGHHAGDRVLKKVARILDMCLRKDDILGRIGGEEFAIYLPATTQDEAQLIANRIRTAVENGVRGPGASGPITMSFGLAHAGTPGAWDTLFQRADEKLYQAKNAGRNRVAA